MSLDTTKQYSPTTIDPTVKEIRLILRLAGFTGSYDELNCAVEDWIAEGTSPQDVQRYAKAGVFYPSDRPKTIKTSD